jgi:Cu2+-exporting ATPase
MKKFFFALTFIAVTTFACQQAQTSTEQQPATAVEHSHEGHDHEGHDDDAQNHDGHDHYACPMACEGEKYYEEPGKCAVCKMDLAKI